MFETKKVEIVTLQNVDTGRIILEDWAWTPRLKANKFRVGRYHHGFGARFLICYLKQRIESRKLIHYTFFAKEVPNEDLSAHELAKLVGAYAELDRSSEYGIE